MAKAKIIAEFLDKQTGRVVSPGPVIDVSEDRLKELESAGCARRVVEQEAPVKSHVTSSKKRSKKGR